MTTQILEMIPADYARHRNVSREAIRKAIERGRIPAAAIREHAGQKLINVAAADLALGQAQIRTQISDVPGLAGENFSPDVAADGAEDNGAAATDRNGSSLTAARTQSEIYNAELRRLQVARQKGNLLEVADVDKAMQRWAEAVIREIDQVPAKADDIAAAFTAGGVDGVRRYLKTVTRQVRGAIEQNMRLLGAEDDAAGDVVELESAAA